MRKRAFANQGEGFKRQISRQANNRKWKVSEDKAMLECTVVSAFRHDLGLVDESQKRVILGELTVQC